MSKANTYIPAFITLASVAAIYYMLRTGGSKKAKSYYPEYDMRMNENLPRGYFNNNPLNIRLSSNNWQGAVKPNTDGAFEQFIDMAHGYRAALITIRTYINKYGLNSVRKIIGRWAPPNENNTESYITNVCKLADLTPDATITANDRDSLTRMVYAMSIIENGRKDKAQNDIMQRYNLPSMEIINEGWRLI